jgi:basic membrane protein A and related proteins
MNTEDRNTLAPSLLLPRRRLLAGGALAAGSLALPGALRSAFAQAPLTVGIIYVGPRDDFGYNQAQAEAAAQLKKMAGLKVIEEENVPETQAVQKSMQGMISQDGATLLFPTSFGYFDPHMLAVAAKNEKVRFAHCGGMWTQGKHPKHRQLLRLHRRGAVPQRRRRRAHEQEQEARLRGRQADPAGAAQHQRLHDGRALGGPEDHHQRHLHRRLVDARQGGRGHQQPGRPGRGRVHDARRRPQGRGGDRRPRGKMVCGYHASQARLAPNAYLTGAEWNWLTAYTLIVDAARSGKPHPNFVRGGLKDGFVKSSPYGAMVTEGARKNAEEVRAKMMAGSFNIFSGELKDNTGKVVIAKGTTLQQTDPVLEGMNYLVEGVIGKA